MRGNSIEISVRGKWINVPAVEISDKTVVVTGKWIKTATIHDDLWHEGELEDPDGFIGELKDLAVNGFKSDIFVFGQKFPLTKAKHPYHMEWDNVAAIRVISFKDWWAGLSQETRRNVRMAEKRGVVARVTEFNDALIKGIVEINNEAPLRQGRPFSHYGKSHDAVRKDYQSFSERSVFIGAYLGEELIGFLKIVYLGEVAAIMQLLLKMSHYDKRAANALIAKAVEHCEKLDMKHLTYCKYRYGKKHKSPLTEFKRRNGFEEVPVPLFYVPLTAKGRIAIALRLHRSLVDLLPEGLIEVLLNLRTRWCEWRLTSGRHIGEGRCS